MTITVKSSRIKIQKRIPDTNALRSNEFPVVRGIRKNQTSGFLDGGENKKRRGNEGGEENNYM